MQIFFLKNANVCTGGLRLKCCHGACVVKPEKWLDDMFTTALCLPSKINLNRYKTCGVASTRASTHARRASSPPSCFSHDR